jgi:site-specific DNA-methyltransferase (adenine-specific)
VQLARVLKKTGSFYYHCDWHASHYVKVMLDQIFGENSFQTEIIWQRTLSKGLAFTGLPNNHDTIFYYGGGWEITFNRPYNAYDPDNLDAKTAGKYCHRDPDGRVYRLDNLINPNPDRPNLTYEFCGVKRVWRWTQDRMREAYANGLVVQTKPGAVPQLKRYLDEQEGRPVDSVWTDIPPINSQAKERLGYPTQKPLALLERIVKMSSNENDIVLDAFCGCGTALVAAQNLKRQWIGIDISPTACRVMAHRLHKDCGLRDEEQLWKIGRGFVLRNLPWTEKRLRELPPFEFENWAVVELGGVKNRAQVGDKGIDGRIFPVSALEGRQQPGVDELPLDERFYAVQVKQRDKTGRPDIDAFETAMRRAKCEKGYFVSFDYSTDAMQEIGRFFREEHRIIVPFTVKEILDGDIAQKLA